MEDKRVMTAPLAIIQINSVTVGKMKNVRITENIRRGRVAGVRQLNPSDLPAYSWLPLPALISLVIPHALYPVLPYLYCYQCASESLS